MHVGPCGKNHLSLFDKEQDPCSIGQWHNDYVMQSFKEHCASQYCHTPKGCLAQLCHPLLISSAAHLHGSAVAGCSPWPKSVTWIWTSMWTRTATKGPKGCCTLLARPASMTTRGELSVATAGMISLGLYAIHTAWTFNTRGSAVTMHPVPELCHCCMHVRTMYNTWHDK